MGLFYCTNSTVRLLFFQLMKKTSAATTSSNQVATWGAGMHPDYIGQTRRGKGRTHGALYRWGDSAQDKEFEEPEPASNANASQICGSKRPASTPTSSPRWKATERSSTSRSTIQQRVTTQPQALQLPAQPRHLYDVKGSYEVKFKISAGATRGACFINFAVEIAGGGWRGVDEQVFENVMSTSTASSASSNSAGVNQDFEPIELGKPVEDYVSKRKSSKFVPAS